jgi:ATP-dependent helicase/nuclease subunit B
MANNLLDFSHFESIDASEVLVLTPNLRLQRRFSQSYGMSQMDKGLTAWLSPKVYALHTWVNETWQNLQDQGYQPAAHVMLADANQLAALWSEIISNDPNHMDIINANSLASPAMEAFRTMQLWQVKDFSSLIPESLESDSYNKWHSQMISELHRRHWVTPEGCVEIIIEAISRSELILPARVVLFSFDEIPPLYNALFQIIRDSGGDLREVDSATQPESMGKVATKERNDQYLMAAQWAKAAIESNEKAAVAVVCPELTKHRAEIEAAFIRVFEPQAILPSIPRYTLPFNFSAGVPLAEIPLIHDALDFLGLGDRKAPYSKVSSLLRSPYIAGADREQNVRSKFDMKLREGHTNSLNLDNLIQLGECPEVLAESIGKFLLHTSNTPFEQKPSQWAYHFGKSLELLGWPGDRNLDSEEFQALTHWHSQLDQLSKLDAVYHACRRAKAMSLLRQCVSRTVFQPKTADSPVQILGILEAAGLHFDHMWVMDLNDDIWPQAPQPNPFIPLAAQKAMSMPHSSSERELAFSTRIVERLKSGADHLIMSYAERDDDKELRCSTLIQDVPPLDREQLVLAAVDDHARILYRAIPLTTIDDGPSPIKQLDDVRGGTGILSSQATCPFQAFAKYRLKASEMPRVALGLSHIERGDLVHHVLEFIWKKLHNQDDLLALDMHDQEILINEAVDFAFFWLRGRRSDLGERLLKLERQRLQTVIGQWLDLERKRAPFTVEECESRVTSTIAGLTINMRRDRVDNIDGRRFHIDYKTGRTSLASWAGDRPDSPQVPLYAIAENDDCVGAAFGQVRRGEPALKGVSEQEGIAYGVIPADKLKVDLPDTWNEIKIHWLKQLEILATEFKVGAAHVMPKTASACKMCHLSALCRH